MRYVHGHLAFWTYTLFDPPPSFFDVQNKTKKKYVLKIHGFYVDCIYIFWWYSTLLSNTALLHGLNIHVYLMRMCEKAVKQHTFLQRTTVFYHCSWIPKLLFPIVHDKKETTPYWSAFITRIPDMSTEWRAGARCISATAISTSCYGQSDLLYTLSNIARFSVHNCLSTRNCDCSSTGDDSENDRSSSCNHNCSRLCPQIQPRSHPLLPTEPKS